MLCLNNWYFQDSFYFGEGNYMVDNSEFIGIQLIVWIVFV